jgi:hypothetical protein
MRYPYSLLGWRQDYEGNKRDDSDDYHFHEKKNTHFLASLLQYILCSLRVVTIRLA